LAAVASAAAPRGDVAVLVPMELVRIVISDINDQQVIFLRESEGDRAFPILIGLFEAMRIDGRVRGELPPRPLTHDLLKNAIEMLGAEVQDVVITHLQDHTYFASIRVKKDGELLDIDSRPSDAIALAVHYDPFLPIYVEDTVLEEVAS
jgi:hypothetical protein